MARKGLAAWINYSVERITQAHQITFTQYSTWQQYPLLSCNTAAQELKWLQSCVFIEGDATDSLMALLQRFLCTQSIQTGFWKLIGSTTSHNYSIYQDYSSWGENLSSCSL